MQTPIRSRSFITPATPYIRSLQQQQSLYQQQSIRLLSDDVEIPSLSTIPQVDNRYVLRRLDASSSRQYYDMCVDTDDEKTI